MDEEKIVTWMCPCDFDYEKLDAGCNQVGAVQENCRECWNRETGDTSSALRAPSPQGEGKEDGKREEGGAGDGD